MGSNASTTAPLANPMPNASKNAGVQAAAPKNVAPKNAAPKNATPKNTMITPAAVPTSQLAPAEATEKPAMNTKGGWAAKAGIPSRRHRRGKGSRKSHRRRPSHRRRI